MNNKLASFVGTCSDIVVFPYVGRSGVCGVGLLAFGELLNGSYQLLLLSGPQESDRLWAIKKKTC